MQGEAATTSESLPRPDVPAVRATFEASVLTPVEVLGDVDQRDAERVGDRARPHPWIRCEVLRNFVLGDPQRESSDSRAVAGQRPARLEQPPSLSHQTLDGLKLPIDLGQSRVDLRHHPPRPTVTFAGHDPSPTTANLTPRTLLVN